MALIVGHKFPRRALQNNASKDVQDYDCSGWLPASLFAWLPSNGKIATACDCGRSPRAEYTRRRYQLNERMGRRDVPCHVIKAGHVGSYVDLVSLTRSSTELRLNDTREFQRRGRCGQRSGRGTWQKCPSFCAIICLVLPPLRRPMLTLSIHTFKQSRRVNSHLTKAV